MQVVPQMQQTYVCWHDGMKPWLVLAVITSKQQLSKNEGKIVEQRGCIIFLLIPWHLDRQNCTTSHLKLHSRKRESQLYEGWGPVSKKMQELISVPQKAIYPNFSWVTKYQLAPGTPESGHKVVSILLQQLKSLRKKPLSLEDQELPTRWPLKKW